MATISRGIQKGYAEEIKSSGVATQEELNTQKIQLEDFTTSAISEHTSTEHGLQNILPTPISSNDIIKAHELDDGTIEWSVVKADDPEEGLKVISLPYYYDSVREKYLSKESLRLNFYENGNNKRRTYMCYIPEIKSNRVPFKVQENETYCITGYEYLTSDENSGKVINIKDVANDEVLYSIDIGDDDVDYDMMDNLDIVIDDSVWIAPRILSTSLDNPVLILYMRKIYIPEG